MSEVLTQLFGALDLTGNPELAYSHTFAGAMMARTLLTMIDNYKYSSKIDFGTNWDSLIFFFVFVAVALACYVLAVVVSVGNAMRPHKFVACRCIFTIVSTISLEVLTVIVRFHHVGEFSSWSQTVFIGVTSVETLLLLTAIGVMCMRLMEKSTHNHVLFEADPQGRWGADDLHGLEQAAGVENSYYTEDASACLVGPDMIAETKSLFYPQPFTDRHRFAQTDKYALIAKDVRLAYPIRLWTAMFMTASVIIIACVTSLVILIPRVGEAENFVDDIVPGLASSSQISRATAKLDSMMIRLAAVRPPSATNSSSTVNSSKQVMAIVINWTLQSPRTASDCAIAFDNGSGCDQLDALTVTIGQALQLELIRSSNYTLLNDRVQRLKDDLHKKRKLRDWWIDKVNIMTVVGICSCIACSLLALWFVWVGKLAYRKKMVELALSSALYAFSPKVMTGVYDTRFVAYFVSSILLAWMIINVVVFICGFLCSLTELWEAVFVDYRDVLVAYCIYMCVILVFVPKAHAKLVLDKDKRLVRPHLQSTLIFVWEIFYAPQVAMSVLLKAIYCMCFAMVMFLRPDVPLLPSGFVWLDSLHTSYVASVYAQVDSAVRRDDQPLADAPEQPIIDDEINDANVLRCTGQINERAPERVIISL